MAGVDDIIGLLQQGQKAANTVAGVTALIAAGERLITVIRSNVEEAKDTASEQDLGVLRERADALAEKNRALSEQLDALLAG